MSLDWTPNQSRSLQPQISAKDSVNKMTEPYSNALYSTDSMTTTNYLVLDYPPNPIIQKYRAPQLGYSFNIQH